MIEIVRQWLTGFTSAALIVALADGLMPKGPVKQAGKLICALVVLCVVLRPVVVMTVPDVDEIAQATWDQTENRRVILEQRNDELLKTLIARESAAYIVDKAARLGAVCQVQVECAPKEGGVWHPHCAYITGQLDSSQRSELTKAIQIELDIPPERQIYAGGE